MYVWWLAFAWSGVPLMFLNDTWVSVATSNGEWPNFGLVLWGLINGPGWCFVMWMYSWYETMVPIQAAYQTLEGYTEEELN